MLEDLFSYLCSHATYAHYFLFGFLLLAGVNIPISEDLVLIIGGVLVSICVEEHYYLMLGWLYVGCVLSAYEAYWLGWRYGHKLYDLYGFRHVVTRERIHILKTFIERFGILTFMVGRFIPGGIRNAIFVTSGMGRMPFGVFAFRDAVAAALSTTVLFQLGYLFGENYPTLFGYISTYEHVMLLILGVIVGVLMSYWWYHRRATQA